MDEKEKSIVEIVNCNITRFACDLGYSYLNAGDMKWENAKGETLELSSMREERLENCVSFIERGIEGLQNKSMDEVIERKVVMFSRKYDDDKILKGKHLKCNQVFLHLKRGDLIGNNKKTK